MVPIHIVAGPQLLCCACGPPVAPANRQRRPPRRARTSCQGAKHRRHTPAAAATAAAQTAAPPPNPPRLPALSRACHAMPRSRTSRLDHHQQHHPHHHPHHPPHPPPCRTFQLNHRLHLPLKAVQQVHHVAVLYAQGPAGGRRAGGQAGTGNSLASLHKSWHMPHAALRRGPATRRRTATLTPAWRTHLRMHACMHACMHAARRDGGPCPALHVHGD